MPLVMLGGNGSANASDRDAAKQVREGVRLHQAGDFEQAAQAFSQAAQALPANPRVAFNQGCALAAQGKHDEAEALLREAALAREPELAAAAYYNLGCLAADEIKKLLGDQPDEAVDPAREQALNLVRAAVDHYRSALRADGEHVAARRNLELLRLWNKHIQDRWSQRDRQRRREKMNLLEFLAWIQDQQRGARRETKALPEQLASPSLRQTARRIAASQRDLTLEIVPLKAKLDAALQQPAQAANAAATAANAAPNATPPLSAEMLRVQQALHGLADQAGASMVRAADALSSRQVTDAIGAQTATLPPLNQLFELLAPFEAILQAAIKSETALVESSTQAARTSETVGPSAAASGGQGTPDASQAAEDQRWVAGWSRTLSSKAEQFLAERNAATASQPLPGTAGPGEVPLATAPESDEAQSDEAEPGEIDANTQPAATAPAAAPAAAPPPDGPPEDPTAAYRKAVELAPRIERLAREAAGDLDRADWSTALPKQEEALDLLKEIAALLPPQDDDQENQEQENQDQDEQQKQDQKQQQQDEQDQKKKQDQKKDPEKEKSDKQKQDEQDKSKSKNKDQNKSDDEKKSSAQKQGQQPENLSRQQAESLLRQVREREREHREMEKEIRRLLRSRVIVEKDW